MKKLLILAVVLITAFCIFDLARQHLFHTQYIADNSLRGKLFWQDRPSYKVTRDNPLIPAQVPGPADGWGGGEPKTIYFEAPYHRDVSFTLHLFETHQTAPPRLEALVNGEKFASIQTKPGTGKGYPAWVSEGRPSEYRLLIPGDLLNREKNTIALRTAAGSWMAVQKAVIRPVAAGWAYAGALGGALLLAALYFAYLKRRRLWKEHALNALLLGVGLLSALGAAELFLRWFFPQQEYVPDVRIVYLPDAETGFRLKPNVKTNLGFNTNRLGMRDYDRYGQAKPRGVYRILCLGDSFTFSLTAMKDSWPKNLERLLADRPGGRKVEVLNAGVMAYGTDNEYYYLKSRGLKLEPDLVLVGFFVGNDITDNYEHPSNTAVDGVLVRIKAAQKYTRKEISWEKKKRAFLNQFHLVRLVNNLSFKGLFRAMDQRSRKTRERMNRMRGKCVSLTGARVHRPPETFQPIIKESWRKTIAYLDDMRRLARARGFKLAVILIPDAMQFDTPEVLAMKKKLGPDMDWRQPQKGLMELAAGRGWDMFNALPAMRARWDGSMIYYCGDTHFNEKGNRLLALTIRAWLLKRFPAIGAGRLAGRKD